VESCWSARDRGGAAGVHAGRTLNDSLIIVDEAQNSTPEQMKMVLTRQGANSKMVVNGDVTQIDLLWQAQRALAGRGGAARVEGSAS